MKYLLMFFLPLIAGVAVYYLLMSKDGDMMEASDFLAAFFSALIGEYALFHLYVMGTGDLPPFILMIIPAVLLSAAAYMLKKTLLGVRKKTVAAIKEAQKKAEPEKPKEVYFQGNASELLKKSLVLLDPEHNPGKKDFLAIQIRENGIYAALQPENYSPESFTFISGFPDTLTKEGKKALLNSLYQELDKALAAYPASRRPELKFVWDYDLITLWCDHFLPEDYQSIAGLFR
ncbi:MAG: hypothetical protein K6D92_04155 [Erysipelotrichaceae bacterium]|nr:hypothetical protein [Erysipelotrichaceae bacterium]